MLKTQHRYKPSGVGQKGPHTSRTKTLFVACLLSLCLCSSVHGNDTHVTQDTATNNNLSDDCRSAVRVFTEKIEGQRKVHLSESEWNNLLTGYNQCVEAKELSDSMKKGIAWAVECAVVEGVDPDCSPFRKPNPTLPVETSYPDPKPVASHNYREETKPVVHEDDRSEAPPRTEGGKDSGSSGSFSEGFDDGISFLFDGFKGEDKPFKDGWMYLVGRILGFVSFFVLLAAFGLFIFVGLLKAIFD